MVGTMHFMEADTTGGPAMHHGQHMATSYIVRCNAARAAAVDAGVLRAIYIYARWRSYWRWRGAIASERRARARDNMGEK